MLKRSPRWAIAAMPLLAALTLFGQPIAAASAELDLLATDGLAVVWLSTITTPLASALRRRRGRPRKFAAPSRALTLTLPESVLETLSHINPDPSQAIVQLARTGVRANGRQPAELSVFGRRAVITIRPSASLEERTGVHLVPMPDGRALISFDQPKSIADLELLLRDALEDPKLSADDRRVFESIADILKEARQSSSVKLLRRSIIVLESADGAERKHAASPANGSTSAAKRRAR